MPAAPTHRREIVRRRHNKCSAWNISPHERGELSQFPNRDTPQNVKDIRHTIIPREERLQRQVDQLQEKVDALSKVVEKMQRQDEEARLVDARTDRILREVLAEAPPPQESPHFAESDIESLAGLFD